MRLRVEVTRREATATLIAGTIVTPVLIAANWLDHRFFIPHEFSNNGAAASAEQTIGQVSRNLISYLDKRWSEPPFYIARYPDWHSIATDSEILGQRQQFRGLSEVGKYFGYSVSDPTTLLQPLANVLGDGVAGFELLRRYAKTNFGLDFQWDDPDPMLWQDVLDIYEGVVAMSRLPRNIYGLYAKAAIDPEERLYRFRRDVTGKCGLHSGGCVITGQPTYIQQARTSIGTYTAEEMVHEFMHRLHFRLLGGLTDWLTELNPPGFEYIGYDAFWAGHFSRNNPRQATAEIYGTINAAEDFATLGTRLIMLDVGGFDQFDPSELNARHPSARVQKFARLVTLLAAVCDRSPSQDLLSLLKTQYVGLIPEHLRLGALSDRADIFRPHACEIVARNLVDTFTFARQVKGFFAYLPEGLSAAVSMTTPGMLAQSPPQASAFIIGPPKPARIQLLKGTKAAEGTSVMLSDTPSPDVVNVEFDLIGVDARSSFVLKVSWDAGGQDTVHYYAMDIDNSRLIGGRELTKQQLDREFAPTLHEGFRQVALATR